MPRFPVNTTGVELARFFAVDVLSITLPETCKDQIWVAGSLGCISIGSILFGTHAQDDPHSITNASEELSDVNLSIRDTDAVDLAESLSTVRLDVLYTENINVTGIVEVRCLVMDILHCKI